MLWPLEKKKSEMISLMKLGVFRTAVRSTQYARMCVVCGMFASNWARNFT